MVRPQRMGAEGGGFVTRIKEKEAGRGLTLTMHLAEANKIGEERACCHALDKERMLAETHIIPMGGEEGDSPTLVRERGIEGEFILETPLTGRTLGKPAQG